MTKLQKVCWVLVTCLGMAASFVTFAPTAWQTYVTEWFYVEPQSKITQAVVVCESRDFPKLSKERVVWINSATLRADLEKKGIEFLVIDPDVKNRDKQTPPELKPFIDAIGVPLPKLVIARGKDYSALPLPANMAEARKVLGL